MEQVNFDVNEENEGVRLDVFLSGKFDNMSRSYIQKIIKEGNVLVNDKKEKSRYITKTSDKINLSIPEPKELEVEAENIDIEIVYEDDDLLVVNKPAGMVVHPAPGNYTGTLVNAILYHCKDNLSSINGVIRPGIVHRIDKDTSGLLMIAKNNNAHNSLSEQLKDHSITRRYHMICYGVVKEDTMTIDEPIARHPVDRLKMAIVEGGKRAVTHFKVLKRFDKYTYVEAELETGRTHQIRVHMLSKKHPLVGDPVYGPKNSKFKLNGQMLHAKTLGFIHPTTNEYMEFNSDIPNHFKRILNILD